MNYFKENTHFYSTVILVDLCNKNLSSFVLEEIWVTKTVTCAPVFIFKNIT